MDIQVAPSILSADFACLGRQVAELEEAGAKILHIDVMDGHFVPNISIGPLGVRALRPHSRMFFDAHLMIERPEAYIDAFAEAGADHITVHWESTFHMHRLIQQIRGAGLQVGVALNPATPFEVLECVAQELDMVLIMSVNPGFGGQEFIESALEKITKAAQWRADTGAKFRIEVDGGMNRATAQMAVQAGAQIIVAGAAVFQQPQPAEAWRQLSTSSELMKGPHQ
ncbi:MAG: ribulose-phosphate 3-epimerase [Peptococcaceae bacterium]|nr:ribulose-phosphate 3-epimerase [Peptococcaceae bacterium]